MFKKQRAKRKFNIVVKITALALCTSMVCLEMSVLNARAKSLSESYKVAHGDENTETALYLWHRLDSNGSKFPFNAYYSKYANVDNKENADIIKESKNPVRMLLTYKNSGGSYYIEADWTKAEFKGNDRDVAGTCIKAVSTKDNTQVLVGEGSFVTRGALRSFFAVADGKTDAAGLIDLPGAADAVYMYHLYAPNETDDDMEKVKDKPLELCNTYANDKNGLWFYDVDGNPYGSSKDEKHWSDSAYNKSKFGTTHSKWIIFRAQATDGQIYHSFIGADDNEADPGLIHTDNDSRFNKMGENQFTLGEFGNHWPWLVDTVDEEYKWIVYVGEKIGTCTNLCGTETDKPTELPSGSSLTLELPYYIRKDQTYIVRKGATLHVASLIELNGTIINYGTIIIESGGAIMGNATESKGSRSIECKGGDIIIKSGGVICVKDFYLSNGDKENGNESSYGQIITLGGKANENLKVSGALTLEKGVFDYKTTGSGAGNDSQAKECNGITMVGYSGVRLDNGKIKYTQTKSKTVKGSDTASFTCGSGDAVIFDN